MDHSEEPPELDEVELKRKEWRSAFDQTNEANDALTSAFEAYMRLEDGAKDAVRKSIKDLRHTNKKFEAANKELLRAVNQRNDNPDRERGK